MGNFEEERAMERVDTTRPNPARMYDYNLGGSHNFAVDREAMERINSLFPPGELVYVGQQNRAFLARAVRYALNRGVTQFLDIGSGIPTVGNVHEIAQGIEADAHVVYVDNEAVAVQQTRRLLAGNDRAVIVHADLRAPETVLDAPETRALLDFERPVALLAVAALHYVDREDDAPGIVAQYVSRLAPGSVVAISHLTQDGRPEETSRALDLWNGGEVSDPMTMRSFEEVTELFGGLELVEPGVVWTTRWHPDSVDSSRPPEAAGCWAGVAVIPGLPA